MITDSHFYYAYTARSLLNYTNHEKYIVEEVKKFSKTESFRNNSGSFGKLKSVPFAETLTKRSVAFTFNILDFDELLNTQA